MMITNNFNTAGRWMIWPNPAENLGGVATVEPAGDLWPHQVRSWKYYSGGWRSGKQLTVTGNINVLCSKLNF